MGMKRWEVERKALRFKIPVSSAEPSQMSKQPGPSNEHLSDERHYYRVTSINISTPSARTYQGFHRFFSAEAHRKR